MNKLLNKKLLILSLLLLPLLVITMYTTYAFYVGNNVEGNEQVSTIAVESGNISISYQSGNDNIVANNIVVGWEGTKTFTVSCAINYSDKSSVKIIWYDMILVVDQNTFENNSIQYSLQISDDDINKAGIFTESGYNGIPSGASNIGIGSGYFLDETTTHTYNLKLRYADNDDVDQTGEENAKFSARVNIAGSKQTTLNIDFNGGNASGTFANSSGSSYKVAANSRIYVPSVHVYKDYSTLSYFEKTDGSGSADSRIITTTSSSISVKAIYEDSAFATDSWAVIANNVRNNNTSMYGLGETKKVEMDINDDGTAEAYRVRVANKSTPSECSTEGFSQTSCGFVVEFVDIITTHDMNPAGIYNGTEYKSGTNLGGWPSSNLYKYINGDTSDYLTYGGTNATLYSKLPSDLQSVIIDTIVVSGHGPLDSNLDRTDGNWESIDKLYLLSTGEIWSNCTTSSCYDAASYPYGGQGAVTTRQLDYYSNISVSESSNYANAIKRYNGSARSWWLRAAPPSAYSDHIFVIVDSYGLDGHGIAKATGFGVAPAFRIS